MYSHDAAYEDDTFKNSGTGKVISVLIADDNSELRNVLKEHISKNRDIKVTGLAKDGVEALEQIKLLKPDVVILDIIMPGLDGLGVLEKVDSLGMNKKPVFLILSAIGQDSIIQKAIVLGAEYYVIKPFDVGMLVSRIRQIYYESYGYSLFITESSSKNTANAGAEDSKNLQLEVVVTRLIKGLGIPPHITGYQYLREAVLYNINSMKNHVSVTKAVYPAVAKRFSSTPQKVERAIRNAIECAWGKGISPDNGLQLKSDAPKPTNSELIAVITEKARMLLGIPQV